MIREHSQSLGIYLEQINYTPLLSATEEVELCKKMRCGEKLDVKPVKNLYKRIYDSWSNCPKCFAIKDYPCWI